MDLFAVVENGMLCADYSAYLTVGGAFNYFVEAEIKRKPGLTNSTVAISVFRDASKAAPVDTIIQWAHTTAAPVPKYTQLMTQSHTYQLSAVGSPP